MKFWLALTFLLMVSSSENLIGECPQDNLADALPRFIFQEIQIDQAPRKDTLFLKAIVRDEQTKKPLVSQVSIIDVDKGKLIDKVEATPPNGIYRKNLVTQTGHSYLLHVVKEGYLYHSEYIKAEETANKQVFNIYLRRSSR